MTKLNPYITLPGTAAQAVELYKEVFGVEPDGIHRFKDIPREEGMSVSPAAGERIMHTSFQIGGSMLMISDAPEGQDDMVVMGSQTNISVHPESRAEADRMFALLSAGGQVVMPMAMQFWGDYFGMCADKFGVRWMINFSEEH